VQRVNVIGGAAAFEKTPPVLAQYTGYIGIQTGFQFGNDPAAPVLGAERWHRPGTGTLPITPVAENLRILLPAPRLGLAEGRGTTFPGPRPRADVLDPSGVSRTPEPPAAPTDENCIFFEVPDPFLQENLDATTALRKNTATLSHQWNSSRFAGGL